MCISANHFLQSLLVGIGIALVTHCPAAGEPQGSPAAEAVQAQPAEVDPAAAKRAEFVASLLKRLRDAFPLRPVAAREQVDPELLMPHFTAEFTRQFQPLLTTELRFIEKVCQPSPEELKTVKAAGEESLKLTVTEYVRLQIKLEQSGYRFREEPEWPNPRKRILDALAQSVRHALAAEKVKRYEQELQSRAAARKRSTVSYTIAKLDRDLHLSPDQRERLSAILLSTWQEEWAQNLEILQHGDRYMPPLPDDQVAPILSEAQKGFWIKRNKQFHRGWGWAGFGILHPPAEEQELESSEETDPAEKEGEKQP